MMQYLDQRIDALKKQLANEAPEVKAMNEPAYRFAIRELELARSAFKLGKMPDSDLNTDCDSFGDSYVCNECGSHEVGINDNQEWFCHSCLSLNIIIE